MKSNLPIWAIPGFLGLPVDWDFLQWDGLFGVDLYALAWESLTAWAKQFNHYTCAQGLQKGILMGYSLGGRLALHALLEKPDQWQAAIIISTHTGIADAQAREKRWVQDQNWADRFEKEDWGSLMHSWNAQEVFAHDSFQFDRQEKNYQRKQLSQLLLKGSLAGQNDLQEQIANLPMPLLWITGSLDQRCCQLAETLTFAHSHSRCVQITRAGHRLPWSQPDIFAYFVREFLQEIAYRF